MNVEEPAKRVASGCYAAADAAGVSRYQYPPNLRTIRVMCTGRVDPEFILRGFVEGAAGIFTGG